MPKGKGGPSGWAERTVAKAKEAGLPVDGPTGAQAEQQELLKQENIPTPSVQGDKFLARFTKTIFDKKKDERIVQIELSVALTENHDELFQENHDLMATIKFLRKHHVGGVTRIEIPNQTFDVYLAPDTETELHLVAAEVRNVNVSTIKAKGDGKTRDILRLSFRVVAPVMKDATRFATTEYGESVWVKMVPAQGNLESEAA